MKVWCFKYAILSGEFLLFFFVLFIKSTSIQRHSTTYLALVALPADDMRLALTLTRHDVAGGGDGAQVVAATSCKHANNVECLFLANSRG